MSQQGVNPEYTLKITTPGGVDYFIDTRSLGTVLTVSNFSTTVATYANQAMTFDSTNSVLPSTPGSTTGLLASPLFGLTVVSAAKNFLGVALQDIPVKDTTKPAERYTGIVAGAGSIVCVEVPTGVTATLGARLIAHSVTGQVTNGTAAQDGTNLGTILTAKKTGYSIGQAGTAYYVGCLVMPS